MGLVSLFRTSSTFPTHSRSHIFLSLSLSLSHTHTLFSPLQEVFGPVMSIIPFDSDEEAVALANDCDFGLGSNVFGSQARARRIAEQLEAGMSSINDFATTYMCQSLPFGGVKQSGFDRFAGEGERAPPAPYLNPHFSVHPPPPNHHAFAPSLLLTSLSTRSPCALPLHFLRSHPSHPLPQLIPPNRNRGHPGPLHPKGHL
jgi:hypothetical protein